MVYRKLYFIFIIIYISVSVKAQQRVVDSLLSELERHPQEDTNRSSLLNMIALQYSRVNVEKGIAYSHQAIELAQRIRLRDISPAYLVAGACYTAAGQDSIAIQMYQQALSIAEREGNTRTIGGVSYSMGILYYNRSEHYQALKYQQKALDVFKKNKDLDSRMMIDAALNSMGITYMALSEYSRALNYFHEGIKFAEQYQDYDALVSIQQNIGLIYKRMENFPRALEYYKKALLHYEKTGDQYRLAGSLSNIAAIHDGLGNHEKALRAYREALKIYQALGDPRLIANSLVNIGITYLNLDDVVALEYLNEALKLHHIPDDKYMHGVILLQIANVYSNAAPAVLAQDGITVKQAYNKALLYLEKALPLIREAGSLDEEENIWETFSKIYERQHDYGKALHAYKNAVSLRDSARSSDKKHEILKKEMEFEFEKKEAVAKAENEKRHALSAAEIKRQRIIRNTSIIGGIALIIVGGIIVMLYKVNRDADEHKREADFRSLVSETEMKALRAQMNPHFIFNSLNSINDYIARHDTDTATLYTTKFARLMRIVLENSEHREVSLADDLKALELYMQLEALRMGKKMQYDIVIDPEIDPEHTMVPPLLLQPFVENAIWHGLVHKKEGGHITITIGQQDGMLYCSVQDNGIGRKQSEVINAGKTAPGKKSLGMKITGERIQIINRVKNAQAEVRFEDLEEGTQVLVKLPLEKSN